MTTQEKLTDRVSLVAFGALYWRDCMGRKDLEWAVEILGEEFARVEAAGESLEELRTYLAERDVRVPEHVAAADSTEAVEEPDLSQDDELCRRTTNDHTVGPAAETETQEQENIEKHISARGTGSGTWRGWAWNRVPPAIEETVRERFAQGWSKSRLAREFRLNRRTVIRICAVTPSP